MSDVVTTIEEPEARRFERSATDIFRAAIGALIVASGLLLGYVLKSFDANLKVALTESFLTYPDWLARTLVVGVDVIASLIDDSMSPTRRRARS